MAPTACPEDLADLLDLGQQLVGDGRVLDALVGLGVEHGRAVEVAASEVGPLRRCPGLEEPEQRAQPLVDHHRVPVAAAEPRNTGVAAIGRSADSADDEAGGVAPFLTRLA